jgi:hypothetical protein
MNRLKITLWIVLAVLILAGIYLFVEADAIDWSSRL